MNADNTKKERRKDSFTPFMTRKWLLTGLFLLLGFFCANCAGSGDDNGKIQTLNISGVSVPNPLTGESGAIVTITGKGFVVGDVITFVSADGVEYSATVSSVTTTSMSFSLPSGIVSGTYTLYLTRGTTKISLSKTTLKVTSSSNVPDKAGMTIKGIVTCNGVGVAGVEVSDGVLVTQTDINGIYYLASAKKYGYVFISIPGGYEVGNDGNSPQFFVRVNSASPSTVEQANFMLTKVDNDKHALLALADFHLANRSKATGDIAQFANFATDVNATISSLSSSGYRVYVLSLGDETWDLYWYADSYALPQAYLEVQKLNAPFFHSMGNHDNDPYCANDWLAEQAWLKTCGPCFYSFNLGKVHYIVLDNIQYLNTGASQGTIGERNYNKVVISEELAWLQKDLSLITDKSTPIVVDMHAPLYARPELTSSGGQSDSFDMTGGAAFANYFSGFSNVNVLTGHTHVNFNVNALSNLMEHNTAAVCASWWWTGKLSNNHICVDGSPGGYGVYNFSGKDLTWYYKSYGYDKDYQFRAYDLNTTYIDPAIYAPNYVADMTTYAREYGTKSTANEVLINVFDYDPKWKVEVTENGTSLAVTRVKTYDPLHIISYDAKRIAEGGAGLLSFTSELTAHLFKAKATSATSTLLIKVTDRFGNVYAENMTRPKAFSTSMK